MNDWDNKKNKIISYYNELISLHGNSALACDYGNPKSREIKFKILSEVCDLNNFNILDVGCGFADYYYYLSNKYDNFKYTGFELNEDCVNKVKKLDLKINISVKDILNDKTINIFNVVTANGIFYLLGNNNYQDMFKLIDRMYNLCNIALSFNSLSSYCNDKQQNEFYANPAKVFEYCKQLTPWVTLRSDYHHRDFTIYMYKDKINI